MLYYVAVVFILTIGFCVILYQTIKKNNDSKYSYQALEQQYQFLQFQVQEKQEEINQLKQEHFQEKQQLKSDYSHQNQLLEQTYQNNLKLLKEELTTQYKEQSNTLLAQNQNLLNQDGKKLLNEIFAPIQEQVKLYSQDLLKNEASLKTQIESMFKYSQSVGANADKLAQILKGDKKVRGNFGEIQLKSLLQSSGLVEGEQYTLQQSFEKDNSRYIPDAIIYLERDKSIIIDAKFTLPNDFDFEQITSDTCSQIANNLKKRIDELSKKPYTQISTSTYDFVLLFIPYQNILDLALSSDPSLYAYAYERKIYLTTPHTLFMALKTIQITWIDIKRNQNATKAFEEIGKFYDKFVGVLESFEELKTHLTRAEKAKNDMANKLTEGNGNLASRFKALEELGVKSKKSLP